jgi:hypothetical protein
MSTPSARHATFLSPDPEAFADRRRPGADFAPACASLQIPSGDTAISFPNAEAAKGSTTIHSHHGLQYPFHIVLFAALTACVL